MPLFYCEENKTLYYALKGGHFIYKICYGKYESLATVQWTT